MQPRAQPVRVGSLYKCRPGQSSLTDAERSSAGEAMQSRSPLQGTAETQSRAGRPSALVRMPGSPGRAKAGSEAAKQTTAGSRAAFTSLGRQSTAAMGGRADADRPAAARIEKGSEGRPQRDSEKAQSRQPGKCTGSRLKAPEIAPEGPKKQSTAGSRKRRSADGSRAGPRQPVRVARVAIALPFAEQPNNSPNGAGRQSGQDASERDLNEFAARAVPGGRWFLPDRYRPAIACHLLSERSQSE